jgi:hypothetical protein
MVQVFCSQVWENFPYCTSHFICELPGPMGKIFFNQLFLFVMVYTKNMATTRTFILNSGVLDDSYKSNMKQQLVLPSVFRCVCIKIEKCLLALSCLSISLSTYSNVAPSGQIFMKFVIGDTQNSVKNSRFG